MMITNHFTSVAAGRVGRNKQAHRPGRDHYYKLELKLSNQLTN